MSQILEIDGSVLEGVSNIIQLVNIIEKYSVENELFHAGWSNFTDIYLAECYSGRSSACHKNTRRSQQAGSSCTTSERYRF